MRSNVTVGPPFDLLLYKKDSLEVTRYRRVGVGDRDLNLIHSSWEQSLRRAVEQLPDIEFESEGNGNGKSHGSAYANGSPVATPLEQRR